MFFVFFLSCTRLVYWFSLWRKFEWIKQCQGKCEAPGRQLDKTRRNITFFHLFFFFLILFTLSLSLYLFMQCAEAEVEEKETERDRKKEFKIKCRSARSTRTTSPTSPSSENVQLLGRKLRHHGFREELEVKNSGSPKQRFGGWFEFTLRKDANSYVHRKWNCVRLIRFFLFLL